MKVSRFKQSQKKYECMKFTYFTDESLSKEDKLNTENAIKVIFYCISNMHSQQKHAISMICNQTKLNLVGM